MAVKNSASVHGKRSRRKADASSSLIPKLVKNPKTTMALALLIIDSLLVSFIIAYVPYTKIDWDAYISQILFGILYTINLGIVLLIYVKTDVLPWWALSLLCLSKRVHSTFLHAAMASILFGWWRFGLIIFSAAFSIKMNVLLFAPSLFVLMLKAMNINGVISALAGAALVQVLFVIVQLNMAKTPQERTYRDNHVCWKLHWHYMCSFIALSILLVVFLQFALTVVDNTFPYIALHAYFRWSGAVMECVPIKLVFISSTPLSTLNFYCWVCGILRPKILTRARSRLVERKNEAPNPCMNFLHFI
ncbi:RNA-directed DNA polymerase (Reverse transcriptase) [Hibiscus syriacus]|uniref:dolichyl-P-Man:Man5GlcNAc2-PP-dolichol alpha-1,3-mannosyltransferase n=1 Tax=Hibiscus syriacus TaxID=106335 RepID=A0A6A2WV55_HIBSY|nr:RNA-directed DNA polymerase (Reverse transcriptase) [Hibiscus syriacus]